MNAEKSQMGAADQPGLLLGNGLAYKRPTQKS
jgi:hypothetical protein